MECSKVIFLWSRGGVTGDTVLNSMCGIKDAKDKNSESAEKNRVARAATKAEDIAKQMTFGRATMEKLEAIEDNNKRVEAVGKLTNPGWHKFW